MIAVQASEKPVILMKPFGSHATHPKTITDLADEIIDWDERANQFDDRGDIFGFERAAVPFQFCIFQIADANNRSVFPNPRVRIVRADPPRIGPGVDRQQAIVDRGGDVHRSAVDADHEFRDTNEADQLQQRSLIGQLDAIFSEVADVDLTIAFSNNDHASRRECDTNFLN